ncbi:MAG: glycosyltransferase [Actinomycetota bacterium]|nr:glycosyltransferase [Actinomycetota bacterium]
MTRVLTWHVHGSYLYYLSQVPVTWYLPVRTVGCQGHGGEGYGGRTPSFPWPDNVVEVAADDVAALELDLVLTQSRANWERDRHDLLGGRVGELPRVHLEHDPPARWPNDALHPVQDDAATLVHVTPFNELMWDNGATPTRVVDHGVVVPDDVPWTGETEAAVTVVNNLYRRGRRLGPDVFDEVAAQVPVDLAGMNGEAYPRWLGDVRLAELHRRLPSYRCFFNPIRYTSMGLAVCEAMALGLPVVGLATTEMSTAVRSGVNGHVETDRRRLAGHVRRLLADRDEAAELSAGARRVARERFGIERFVRDWLQVLGDVTGAAVPA